MKAMRTAVPVAILALVVCLAPVAMASLHADETLASQFAAFKQRHGKMYGSAAEEAYRLRVFKDNLFVTRLHAAANPHATFGVTPFSDLTREEFEARYHNAAAHFAAAAMIAAPRLNLVHAGCQREGPETSAVNGVILILIGDAGNRFAGDMLPRLEAYFLSRYRYPVHIFYETLPESMQVAIERAIPSATRVEFEDVSRMWQALPRGVTEEMLEAWMNTREQLRQKKRGYRIMCRFWAGLVWQLPSLDRYEYYWRLDDDSFLTAPLPCDVFQVMQARQCVYGYRLILKEGREVTVDIWPTFLRWAETKLSVADISEISDMFVTGNETLGKKKFRSFMYYNNFELGTIALKRHPLYRSMFRFMDEEEPHGIMRYRWGDAPVHTLGVEVVLHREGWKKCQFSPSLGGYIHTKDPRLPPLPTSRPT